MEAQSPAGSRSVNSQAARLSQFARRGAKRGFSRGLADPTSKISPVRLPVSTKDNIAAGSSGFPGCFAAFPHSSDVDVVQRRKLDNVRVRGACTSGKLTVVEQQSVRGRLAP